MIRRGRASWQVVATLVAGIPAVTALSWAGAATRADVEPATTPSTVTIVAESVATARNVVPFGVSSKGTASTVWAIGQTRAPSTQQPGPDPPPQPTEPDPLVRPIDDKGTTSEPVPTTTPKPTPTPLPTPTPTPVHLPENTTPPQTVLLAGLTSDADATTAWQRAEPPLGSGGTALNGLEWRPAGGSQPQHTGAATPKGAAALLVELGPAGDASDDHPGILARRPDGRFALLPDPPASVLAPSTTTFDLGSDRRLPFAVVDGPAVDGSPTATPTPTPTPTPSGSGNATATSPATAGRPGSSTPAGSPAATTPPGPSVQTGVLIAAPSGDGVLSWDGTTWSKEPYLDASGQAPTEPRSPIALAATPTGDGVALVQNADTSSPTRFRIYRRTADHKAWREVTIKNAPLLSGPLPAGVQSVKATPAGGDPLTVTDGHWWIDLLATKLDGDGNPVTVSVTVHLVPGKASVTGTTPDATTPTSTTPADTTPGTSPADTTPAATTPAGTTPDATTPAGTTPDATTPTTPTVTSAATATGTWCEPAIATCTHDLGADFATDRGYRSQAFPGSGFGQRVITSPVVPGVQGTTPAVREASASGGYLALVGDRFKLRSGVGDDGNGGSETQAAAFRSETEGWVGGRRAVGHVLIPGFDTPDDLESDASDQPDAMVAVAASPPGMEPSLAGAIAITGSQSLRRQMGGTAWQWSNNGISNNYRGGVMPAARAIAWPRPELVVIVGTNGMLVGGTPPLPDGPNGPDGDDNFEQVEQTGDEDFLSVAFNASGPLDGWAVGRDGAAYHISETDKQIGPVPLGSAVTGTTPDPDAPPIDLVKVAYAGDEPLFASTVGLLKFTNGAFSIDRGLEALLTADGRGPGVRSVAGLPNGAAEVDARYIRDSATAPWRRLPSPAEGDVIDSALTLDPSAPPSSPPVVVASISNATPDRRGPYPAAERRAIVDPEAPPPTTPDVTTPIINDGNPGPPTELAPTVDDGRLEQLGPSGWIDRARLPMEISTGRDLPLLGSPVASLAFRADGTGYAVGGRGTYLDYSDGISAPRGYSTAMSVDLSAGQSAVTDGNGCDVATGLCDALPISNLGTATSGVRAERASVGSQLAAREAAEGAADPSTPDPTTPDEETTPTTPADTTPVDTTPGLATTPPVTLNPDATTRILIGGHPACLDECAGRDDQRVGPTATLLQALQTAARVRDGGGVSHDPPVSALVIGGGRASKGGAPLSAPGADDYADLLRSVPRTPPVFPVIGTGDASTDEGRQNFATRVAKPFIPTATPTANGTAPAATPGLPSPLTTPGEGLVAYAVDIPARNTTVRLIAIDNVVSGTKTGLTDRERLWLEQALSSAHLAGFPAIVVGGPTLDKNSTLSQRERDDEILRLSSGSASAYVATDGGDDMNSVSTFGPRASDTVVEATGGIAKVEQIRSAALGQYLPFPVQSWGVNSERAQLRLQAALSDWSGQPLLVALDVDTSSPNGLNGGFVVSVTTIPVFRSAPPAPPWTVERGFVQSAYTAPSIDADNGVRWTDPDPIPGEPTGPQNSFGFGNSYITPDQCRLYSSPKDCGDTLPTDMTYSTADPSIAVFVRARAIHVKNTRFSNNGLVPAVVLDDQGNPIVDPQSPVLCPIATGTTTYSVTTGGRTLTFPLQVVTPSHADTTTTTGAKNAPCGFQYYTGNPKPEEPAPAKPPVKVLVPPGVVIPPHVPVHHHTSHHHAAPHHHVTPHVAPAPPLASFRLMGSSSALPPFAPNPKPITTPGTPAPPTGVSTQQVPQHAPSPNLQTQSVVASVQEEARKKEVARESTDYHATIYRPASHSNATTALTAGLLALLFGSTGAIVGRRRTVARRAYARTWR